MSNVTNIMTIEQKIDRIVEALRTATGDLVYSAFCQAPTENLMHMRDMILHILSKRDDIPECECE